MLKGNPKQKMLYELDQSNPEEALAYHVATLNMLREHIASHGILNGFISKLIYALILDYTWLYTKRVITMKYPDAYLNAEERVRYQKHLERLEDLNFYLSERTFLLDVTSDLKELEKMYMMQIAMDTEIDYNHQEINKKLQENNGVQNNNTKNRSSKNRSTKNKNTKKSKISYLHASGQ